MKLQVTAPSPRTSLPDASQAQWYKDAVIYQLHVRAFFDSSDDGVGDFAGLTRKLDYLQDLGVTAIWLLPFYPSPLRDDGYDIADYTDVNPAYGTIKDFRSFLREAHSRGLRVITEMVLNHTSDQHPWFQRARRAKPGSPARDFYVWSDTPDRYAEARIIFKDFEPSNWSWDPVAQAYYWHRFYAHQPDLNFDNPQVHAALFQALDFWLRMGVDGLRLDAVPYLYEREGTNCENLPQTHEFLRRLRSRVDQLYPGTMLLAEANQWPEDAIAYFGDGDECHTAFHFPVMPRLFMGLHMEDRFPIVDILQQTPPIPDNCQWLMFLRNHDELTLEMVTDEERDYMYRVYAHDPQARINLGIRRRLAPLLQNNRRKIELLNGLLFSLPGTPVIYYGDEIGMGDNIYLGDRNGVRTPMQWSNDRNAGFSRANPQQLFLPVNIDSEYIYETINVETQRKNPESLWWWMKRLIALSQRHPCLRRGRLELLQPANSKVLAFVRVGEQESVLVVANMSRYVQYVELDLAEYEGIRPRELFGQTHFPTIGQLPYLLTLGPHAFYWFQLDRTAGGTVAVDVDSGVESAAPAAIELRSSWEELVSGRRRSQFEAALATWLPGQRWFQGSGRAIQNITLDKVLQFANGRSDAGKIVIARVDFVEGEPERYSIPITAISGDYADRLAREAPEAVIASLKFRERDESAILVDATWEGGFTWALLETIARRRRASVGEQGLATWSTPALQQVRRAAGDALSPSVLRPYRSNSSIIYGDKLILKWFRRVEPGPQPEVEVGRYLTETAHFEHAPAVVGGIEYRPAGAESMTLGVLNEFAAGAVTAWQYTREHVDRMLEWIHSLPIEQRPLSPDETPGPVWEWGGQELTSEENEILGSFLHSAALLGERTGQLHLALGSATATNKPFAPEPFTQFYQRSLYQSLRKAILQSFQALRAARGDLPETIAELADEALGLERVLLERARRIIAHKIAAPRIRVHGDLHLGQLLHVGHDFLFIDFEGYPDCSLTERAAKRSPLEDVAGMVRSFFNVGWYALDRLRQTGVVLSGDVPSLAQVASAWSRYATSAFLRSYRTTVASGTILPESEADTALVLDHHLLARMVKELADEVANRPNWLASPLASLLDLCNSKE